MCRCQAGGGPRTGVGRAGLHVAVTVRLDGGGQRIVGGGIGLDGHRLRPVPTIVRDPRGVVRGAVPAGAVQPGGAREVAADGDGGVVGGVVAVGGVGVRHPVRETARVVGVVNQRQGAATVCHCRGEQAVEDVARGVVAAARRIRHVVGAGPSGTARIVGDLRLGEVAVVVQRLHGSGLRRSGAGVQGGHYGALVGLPAAALPGSVVFVQQGSGSAGSGEDFVVRGEAA